eukprot:TRINITY_DN5263_c5_g1_i1.p1 TRINITY_DN5263_c5_g1~~TRINITY_DN5263_c5_g1_i1.p1  ORF type:complete len:1588 (+),score=526.34 TRINITY_DN5263_c5_g1_i1:483-4766(+)
MAFVTEGADLDRGAMKGCLFAMLEIAPGRRVAVFNCHLQATHTSRATTSGKYENIREGQLRELRSFVIKSLHRMHHDGPVLLTGDFNIDAMDTGVGVQSGGESSSVAYKHLCKTLCEGIRSGRDLLDLLYLQEHGHVSTRPPRQSFPSTVTASFNHKYPQRLDYVWWDAGEHGHSDHLRPAHVSVRKFRTCRNQVFTHLSDHYGILVELEGESLVEAPTPRAVRVPKEGPYRLLRKMAAVGTGFLSAVMAAVLWQLAAGTVTTMTSTAVACAGLLLLLVAAAAIRFLVANPLRRRLRNTVRSRVVFDTSCDTIAANWRRAVHEHGGLPGYGSRPINRSTATREPYVFVTFAELAVRVENFGAGLQRSGVQTGDRVGLWSEGRRSWTIADLACATRSLVSVAIPWQIGMQLPALRQMLCDARCRVLVCTKTMVAHALQCRSPHLNLIVQMQDTIEFDMHQLAREHGVQLITCAFVESAGRNGPRPPPPPEKTDLATITFRQDSEGTLRAIGLSHENVMASVRALVESGALGAAEKSGHLSHLSTECFFERVMHYACHYLGIPIGFSQAEASMMMADVRAFRPSFVVFEPPTLRRAYDEWQRLRRREATAWKRLVYYFAYRVKLTLHGHGYDSPLLNHLVFRGWRDQLGGNVKTIFVHSPEQLERRLRIFTTIVFCAPVHTVVAPPDCGILLLSLGPVSNMQHRLGPIPQSERRRPSFAFARLTSDLRGFTMSLDAFKMPDLRLSPDADDVDGEEEPPERAAQFPAGRRELHQLLVAGPSVRRWEIGADGEPVAPEDDIVDRDRRWLPTGFIVRKAEEPQKLHPQMTQPGSPTLRGCELEIIGRSEDLLWQADTHVLANRVERCIMNSPRLHTERRHLFNDCFITCECGLPLVGVIVPDQDELLAWAQQRDSSIDDSSETHVYAQITPLLLRAIEHAISDNHLPDTHIVQAIYLHPRPFQSDGLVGTHLKRALVKDHFASPISEMYRILQQPADPQWQTLYPDEVDGMQFPALNTPDLVNMPFAAAVDVGNYLTKFAFVMQDTDRFHDLPDGVQENEPLWLDRPDDEAPRVDATGQAVIFLRMPTPVLPTFLEWLAKRSLITDSGVPCCGAAAERFRPQFRDVLGVDLMVETDSATFIRGLHGLLRLRHKAEVFTLPRGAVAAKRAAEQVSAVPLSYPYLAVNVGSGVSVFLVKDAVGSFERVAGSSIGGGTFWGMCKMMTKIRTWEDLEAIRDGDAGSNAKVDLLVGDTHIGSSDPTTGLQQSIVASSFGRVGRDWSAVVAERFSASPKRQGSGSAAPPVDGMSLPAPAAPLSPRVRTFDSGVATPLSASLPGNTPRTTTTKPPTDADIAASLLHMVGHNIAHIAHLNARVFNAGQIFFGGGFVSHNLIVQAQLSDAVAFWSKDSVHAMFMHRSDYLTVLGLLFGSRS